jgi:hypothetical protein
MTAASLRDIERLSAYLDGELSRAERVRLESRLAREADLSAALDKLRATRALLRRTPRRRAPRSFTLTPKMAGLRPPLPRTVPVLRFAFILVTLLLFVTFAGNLLGPIAMGAQAPAPQEMASDYGGGVGGGPAENATEATEKSLEIESTSTPEANALLVPASQEMTPAYGGGGPVENTAEATEQYIIAEATPTSEIAASLAPQATLESPPVPEARTLEQPATPSVPTVPEERAAKPGIRLSLLQIALLALAVILGGAAIILRWQTNRAFAKNVQRKT